ncbi:hypothetical protein [Arenibaculum pallidiluteum]|uniref:hypothetical protein n=1 Tax=Arenibaculum pallidiluteum TaxID=2812559 RepID=UPI001A95C833|nr:hypothetical protein [Arenibaculum pallidiluteum]
MDEPWGSVPAWRIKTLRLALLDAEQRGADPEDAGDDLGHRALRRRFLRGRGALRAIARNFGLFRSLVRRSAYGSPNDRAWIETFLAHYVGYGRLTERQAQVLQHVARRWGVKEPVRDTFVEWAPRIVKVEAPPRRPRLKASVLARRLAAYRTATARGADASLLELLEAGLEARGARRRSASRLLLAALREALSRESGEEDEDSEQGDTDDRDTEDDSPEDGGEDRGLRSGRGEKH